MSTKSRRYKKTIRYFKKFINDKKNVEQIKLSWSCIPEEYQIPEKIKVYSLGRTNITYKKFLELLIDKREEKLNKLGI